MKVLVFICTIMVVSFAEETKKDKRGLLGLGDLSYGYGSSLAPDHGLEYSAGPILSAPLLKSYAAPIAYKSAPLIAPAPIFSKSILAPSPLIAKSYSAPLLAPAPLLTKAIAAPIAIKSAPLLAPGPIIASAPLGLGLGYGAYGAYGAYGGLGHY